MHCRAVRISRVDLDRRIERLARCPTSTNGLEKDVVAPVLVHQRPSGLARLQHVDHRRQLFEIDRDRAAMSSASRAGRRDAHRDQLADVAHLAGRQHRLLGHLEAGQAPKRRGSA